MNVSGVDPPGRVDRKPCLNYDILSEIAYCADRQTCASLMLTCRALNKAAAKSLLRRPYFSHDTTENIRMLLNFLDADISRFHHVHELSIYVETLPPQLLDRLLNGLKLMTQLKTLDFDDGEEITQRKILGFVDTIAGLTTIHRLSIYCAAEATCELLSKLQSPLAYISIDWLLKEDDFFSSRFRDTSRSHEWPYHHHVPLLSKFSTTLEELECNSWFTCPTGLPQFPYVYPKLRKLSIYRDDNPLVASYIRAYPNLVELTVLSEYHQLWDYSSGFAGTVDAMRQLQECRANNIRSQEEPGGVGTWPQLQNFAGTVVDLYLIGITCPILRVRISGFVYSRDLELLPPALAYVKPQHFNMYGDTMLLIHPSYGLIKLLCEPCAAHLSSLVVRLDMHAQDLGSMDIPRVLNDFAETLSHLPLRRLRLRIHALGLDPAHPGPHITTHEIRHGYVKGLQLPSLSPLTELEESLRNLDIDTYLRRLVDAIPSLEDVVMCISGERDGVTNESRTRTGEVVKVRRVAGTSFKDDFIYEWTNP